jgi:hypothetical protein
MNKRTGDKMEEETLTTENLDSQVNTEENVASEEEVNITVDQPDESIEASTDTGNDQSNDAYSDAWDKIDVNDFESVDTVLDSTTEEEPQVNLNEAEPADVNDIKDTMNAFMVDKPVLKYKGKDIPIDDPNELIALAQKGFSYESEMAKIKPQKKVLNIVEGIPADVLQAVKDLHSGNTSAIEYLKKTYGIEDKTESSSSFFDDEPESTSSKTEEYKPQVETTDPVLEIWNGFIESRPADAGKVNEIYSQLDESFKAEVYKPEVFPAFIESVVSGEFDEVYPLAVKEKTLNPAMTWLQAYAIAVKKRGNNKPQQTKPASNTNIPKTTQTKRSVSDTANYDKVWEDDSYFKELEKQIFQF